MTDAYAINIVSMYSLGFKLTVHRGHMKTENYHAPTSDALFFSLFNQSKPITGRSLEGIMLKAYSLVEGDFVSVVRSVRR